MYSILLQSFLWIIHMKKVSKINSSRNLFQLFHHYYQDKLLETLFTVFFYKYLSIFIFQFQVSNYSKFYIKSHTPFDFFNNFYILLSIKRQSFKG